MSPSRTLVLSSLLAALAGAAAAVSAPASHASSAASCSVAGQERKLGPTYVTSLRVTGTSCAGAKRLVKGYYRCRVKHGSKAGRCTARVLRYRCSERRFNVIPTQYDARVTCRRGARRVVHDYTQFT
jgi:hypothetical protein